MNTRLSLVERLIRLLAHPRLPLYSSLAAVLLTLPGLFIGLQMDDYFHRRYMLQPEAIGVSPWQVFSALDGDSTTLHDFIDVGVLPWWTAANFRLAFCRYLSTASMMLDYRLWPNQPILMHVHSLLWYLALVWLAALLYRRFLSSAWVAGLAALLFALDESHAVPVAWLANRNALIATTFGLAALWAHDRWRRDGWRPGATLSVVLLLAGLFSGEMALAALAFLAAYAVVLEAGTRMTRALSLAPALTALVVWATVYKLLGLGAAGSGFYLDPLHDPPGFVRAVMQHVPILLLGQWTPIPAELGMVLPPASVRALWAAGLAIMVILVALLWRLIQHDPVARFFALGAAGALLPISAVAPSNRLLFFVGFGSMALLSLLLSSFVGGASWIPTSRIGRGLVAAGLGLLFLFHLIVAPLAKPFMAYSSKPMGASTETVAESIPEDPALRTQDLVLVNSPDFLFDAACPLSVKALAGDPMPPRLRALVCGPTEIELHRPDDHTLHVHADRGIFQGTLGRLFRPASDPMVVGFSAHVTGLDIVVKDVNEAGDPTSLDFRFDFPLEDARLRWLLWSEDRYVSFVPPPVGQSLRLPASYGSLDQRWR